MAAQGWRGDRRTVILKTLSLSGTLGATTEVILRSPSL